MRLLVDAHALIWAVDDPSKLSPRASTEMQDPTNDLLVGAGTLWEIGIKVGLTKLSLSTQYRVWANQAIRDLRLSVLPITVDHIDAQAALPNHHRDPFDRLLVAQAQVEQVQVVSSDVVLDQYQGFSRLW